VTGQVTSQWRKVQEQLEEDERCMRLDTSWTGWRCFRSYIKDLEKKEEGEADPEGTAVHLSTVTVLSLYCHCTVTALSLCCTVTVSSLCHSAVLRHTITTVFRHTITITITMSTAHASVSVPVRRSN